MSRIVKVNQEAIRLYRDILRASRLFRFPDQNGRLWSDVLRKSARKEFEASRFITDGEEIARKLVVGRQSLNEILSRVQKKVMS